MQVLPIIKEDRKYSHDGHIFDSKEEIYFKWFLDDALTRHHGCIKRVYHNEDHFKLSKKTKLFREHIYTPDFVIEWYRKNKLTIDLSESLRSKDIKDRLVINDKISYIEIKGGYSIYNNHREFAVNQKWLFSQHGIYVQKIEIPKFFKNTFMPERYLLTDTGKMKRKIK